MKDKIILNGKETIVDLGPTGHATANQVKSAVGKKWRIPYDKQRVFVGVQEVTDWDDQDRFCTRTCGEIHVVDEDHRDAVPRYRVTVTNFIGESGEVVLRPAADATQLKAQLAKSLALDAEKLDRFEVVSALVGVLDVQSMYKFRLPDRLRLVHKPFKMGCTIVMTDTGETRRLAARADPKWTPLKVIEALEVPMGEYRVTVDGTPCTCWSRALTWGAGAHDASSLRIEVRPGAGFQIFVNSYTGDKMTFTVHENWTIEMLNSLIYERTGMLCEQQRLISQGKQWMPEQTFAECKLVEHETLNLVPRLSGGKPVILFYPPTAGPHAATRAFETITSVTLHAGCRFTTLMPRPEQSADDRTVTWTGTVERPAGAQGSERSSAHVRVNGRRHSYLFWEFENEVGADATAMDEVSSLVGYRSLLDHVDSAYLVQSMEEYEDWCDTVLGKLGLGVRERDDFATFWAGRIAEAGPSVVLRVVSEAELAKCADLRVVSRDDTVDVRVRRVYVTMLATHKLPREFEEHHDRLCRDWHGPLPAELSDSYPIVYAPESLTVVEWGGILLTL